MTEPAGIETVTDQAGPGVIYQGHIGIEWPPARPGSSLILPGWGCQVWDALSGQKITTVTGLAVHATANGLVTADVTMYADPDGQPVYSPFKAWQVDGEMITGTFPFLVAEMRVRQSERTLEPAET